MKLDRAPGCILLLGLLLTAACGPGQSAAPEVPIPDPAQLAVPDPDLGEMEPALQAWLNRGRQEVVHQAAEPDADPAVVAKAFGQIGQLYHIFDFLDAAETCYDNARRLLPREYRWIYLLTTVYLEKGKLEEAVEGLGQALELQPDSLAAWIRLGDARLDLDRPEEAGAAYLQALELDPDSAAAIFGLGRVDAALDRPQQAIERFERALDLQPQASVIRYPLAQAYRKLGRLEEAQKELERRGNRRVDFPDPPVDELSDLKTLTAFQVVQSLAADVQRVPASQLLGFALTHLGKVRGTIEPLEGVIAERYRASASPPTELARLHYVAGALLVNERSDTRAIDHFRTAVELVPDFVDAHVKLGNALARNGRLDEALGEFSRALELDPGDRELRVKLATALLNRGRSEEAMAELRRLVAEEPGDPTARIRVAEALEAAGNLDAAEREYRSHLEAELPAPDQARIHRAFAAFLSRRGRFDTAVGQYQRALELDQNLVGARSELAALLGHLGRLGEAASQYAQVVAVQPDNEAARLGEVTALLLEGRLDEAETRLAEGVAVLPASGQLAHVLARLLATAPDETLRQGERALELALVAYEAHPLPDRAETVAMAYAELGRFAEAVEWQRRVIDQVGGRAGSEGARARLTLYESGHPFRAPSPEPLLETLRAPSTRPQPGRAGGR